MKASKIINIIFTAMLLICMVPAINVHAQEQGLRWSKWSKGQDISGSTGSMPDNVVNSYIDSVGNTYIFGRCGKDACLSEIGENGPYICPMDSPLDSSLGFIMVGNAPGVYLAKIDSAGTILWCKSVRGATANHLTTPWNMVVKGDSITIAFDAKFDDNPYLHRPNGGPACWLYFLDTLIRTSGNHFYRRESVTYFVTLDLDGNVIDVHDVRLWAKWEPSSLDSYTCRLGGLTGGRFGIDDDGSIHIFSCTTGYHLSEDSSHRAYIIVDGDTNRKYPLNIHTQNGHYCFPTVYYKMSSDWHLLNLHNMIDTIEGWQPNYYYSSAILHISNLVVDGGDIFVNGYFKCDDWYSIIDSIMILDSFNVKVSLDSIHYLQIDNFRDIITMPFLLKMNTAGDIVWVQQIYTESPNDDYPNFFSSGYDGLAIDENLVYNQCWPSYAYDSHTNPNFFYLDSAHTIPMVNHTIAHTLITCYDKQSGNPVDFFYVDTMDLHESQCISIQGDEILLEVAFQLLRKAELCKINKHTKAVTKMSPITYSWTNVTNKSFSVNSNGWVFRASRGEGARVYDSIPVSPTSKASIMTFFYDSSLDMRPKPCPKVDSLWGSTSQHTASIHWSSTFSHTGYELAYMPDGSSWDNATTLETSATTATITLPDDQCYQFRIRGLCDGHRVATSSWSTPITLCPEVGISDVENSSRITLSPNPSTGKVTIQGLIEEPLSIELFDITGRPVATFTDTTFNISHLPQGNYIVKVTSVMGNTYHLKLIKK